MFLLECILKDFFYFNDSIYFNEEKNRNNLTLDKLLDRKSE